MALIEPQIPEQWPNWLKLAYMPIIKHFGVTDDWLAERRWLAAQAAVRETLKDVELDSYVLGIICIISGKAKR